jgi:hypothetical protein
MGQGRGNGDVHGSHDGGVPESYDVHLPYKSLKRFMKPVAPVL